MNQPAAAENKMGVMPVPKLLLSMAMPMIISMLVQALYNVVDTLYISRVSDAAVNALTLAFPVQNLLIGFATGVGVGVNSMFSKALGEGNLERANRTAQHGLLLSLGSMAIFVLFGMVALPTYFGLLSNDAQAISDGVSYLSICCVCSCGIFIEILFERLLQATGRTFYTMITQGVGAILNIVLDPVFIFGFGPIQPMGTAGAAVATVIGQIVAAILAVIFNLTSNPEVLLFKKSAPRFKLSSWVLKPILSIGIPSVIMVAIGSVMNFGTSYILQGMDTSGTATNVFGIYFKLQSFFFMPLFGINNATISILAYNYGARKPRRITAALKLACLIAFCFTCLGFLSFEAIPQMLLGLFEMRDPNFLVLGGTALRIIGIHFPIAAFCIALGAAFQALGVGIYSTIVSLCRQLLVLLPVAYLLSLTGSVDAVWWSFPIAELASLLVTSLCFIRIYRRKIHPMLREEAGA